MASGRHGQSLWSSPWALGGVAVISVIVLAGILLAAWTPFILLAPAFALALLLAGGALLAGDDDAPEGRVERRWTGAYEDPHGRHAVRTEGMISDRYRGV